MFILFLNSLPVKVLPSLSEVHYAIENLSMEFGNFSNFQKLLVFNTETLKYSDIFSFNEYFTNRLCMITNNDIEHISYTK